jgi:hypothetical protein
LAADEAGFSRIAHGQYGIFIALPSCDDESRVSNKILLSKGLSKYSKQGK